MWHLAGICLQQLFQISVLSLFLFALPENRLESVVVVVGATIYLYLWSIKTSHRTAALGVYKHRIQILRTLLPVLNRRLTSVDPEDDALQLKPTGFETMVKRWPAEREMSEDEKSTAFDERLREGGAFWSSDTLEKVDRVLNSFRSRRKKLDKSNRLLDDDMTWVSRISIPELAQNCEEEWRGAIPSVRRAASASYIRNGCFVGQCGLVLLKAATLL